MFQGIYNGSQKHPNDLDIVLNRAWTSGLDKIIVTVGSVSDHVDAIKLVQKDGNFLEFNLIFPINFQWFLFVDIQKIVSS